jgi:hypothetical protein
MLYGMKEGTAECKGKTALQYTCGGPGGGGEDV